MSGNRTPSEIEAIKSELRKWYARGSLRNANQKLLYGKTLSPEDSMAEAVQLAADNVGPKYQLSREKFMDLMAEAIDDTM